jgi:hypothetical protein
MPSEFKDKSREIAMLLVYSKSREGAIPLYTAAQARALADAEVAREREACAVLAWSTGMDYHSKRMLGAICADARDVGSKCAYAIRARGQVK